MKNILLLMVVALTMSTTLFAQDKEVDKGQDTKSKTLEFLAKDGSFK